VESGVRCVIARRTTGCAVLTRRMAWLGVVGLRRRPNGVVVVGAKSWVALNDPAHTDIWGPLSVPARVTTIGQRPRDISKYHMASHGACTQPARSPVDARCLVHLGEEVCCGEQEAALERRPELDVRRRVEV
jgi:hypothetical protein